jgi:hypothetical protein
VASVVSIWPLRQRDSAHWPERRICTRCLAPVKDQHLDFYLLHEAMSFWLTGLCIICQQTLIDE